MNTTNAVSPAVPPASTAGAVDVTRGTGGTGTAAAGASRAAVGGTAAGAVGGTAAGASPAAVAGTAPRGVVAAFLRFVLFGGGVTLLSSVVLMLVAGRVSFAAANAVVTVASTLLATELHHRFTFGARGAGRAGWRIHSKSALTLVVAYLFTTAAVLTLGALHPHPAALLAQAVYLGASGLAGIGRFALLRLVVFARRPARQGVPALHRGRVAVAA